MKDDNLKNLTINDTSLFDGDFSFDEGDYEDEDEIEIPKGKKIEIKETRVDTKPKDTKVKEGKANKGEALKETKKRATRAKLSDIELAKRRMLYNYKNKLKNPKLYKRNKKFVYNALDLKPEDVIVMEHPLRYVTYYYNGSYVYTATINNNVEVFHNFVPTRRYFRLECDKPELIPLASRLLNLRIKEGDYKAEIEKMAKDETKAERKRLHVPDEHFSIYTHDEQLIKEEKYKLFTFYYKYNNEMILLGACSKKTSKYINFYKNPLVPRGAKSSLILGLKITLALALLALIVFLIIYFI